MKTTSYQRYEMRKKRISKRIRGTSERPRLSVYRSASHLYAQVIDDTTGMVIAAASSLTKGMREGSVKGGVAIAAKIGESIAIKAIEKGVKKVVFDRGGWLYHGRIKALAEGARKAGLDF